MIQNATAEDLKGAIREHLQQTERHAANVERVFAELGQEVHRETNAVAQGLVSEAQEGMHEARSAALRDCAIVSAVIKVEP
jgi:ferritin-like metal-binding protein YciE